MKRTVIEEQVENALEEQKKLIDDEHWYLSIEEKRSESKGFNNTFFLIRHFIYFSF